MSDMTLANVADKIISYIDARKTSGKGTAGMRDGVVDIMLEGIPQCFRSAGSNIQSAIKSASIQIEKEATLT